MPRRAKRSEYTRKLEVAKQEADSLREQLQKHREDTEARLDEIWPDIGVPSAPKYGFSVVRSLRGHFGKIYALHWAGNDKQLVSASQDGKLLIWDADKETRTLVVDLTSAWVMTCAFEQATQKYVACGGLDNMCSIYQVSNPASPTISEPAVELTGHEGYLSCCRFRSQSTILTSSGDSTCSLWDIQANQRTQVFSDHTADVMLYVPYLPLPMLR